MIMGLVSRTPLAVQANNYRRPRKVCLERLLQNVLKATVKHTTRIALFLLTRPRAN